MQNCIGQCGGIGKRAEMANRRNGGYNKSILKKAFLMVGGETCEVQILAIDNEI
jgi:hypothetical protein